jgi:NAD+ synthase
LHFCIYANNKGMRAAPTPAAARLTEAQVLMVWADINAKRRATRYLHEPPLLVEWVLDPA